jgi:hypothetical protein
MLEFDDILKVFTFNVLFCKANYKEFGDDEVIPNYSFDNEEKKYKAIDYLKTPLGKQIVKVSMEMNVNKVVLKELKTKGLKNTEKNKKIIMDEKKELNYEENDLPHTLHLIHTNIINKKDKYEERLEQRFVKENIIQDEDEYMDDETKEKRKEYLNKIIKAPIYLFLEDKIESYLMPDMSLINLFLAMSLFPNDKWAIYKNQYYSVVVNNWGHKPSKVFDMLYYYKQTEENDNREYINKLDNNGTRPFMLATNYKQFNKVFNEIVEKDAKIKPKNGEIILM